MENKDFDTEIDVESQAANKQSDEKKVNTGFTERQRQRVQVFYNEGFEPYDDDEYFY